MNLSRFCSSFAYTNLDVSHNAIAKKKQLQPKHQIAPKQHFCCRVSPKDLIPNKGYRSFAAYTAVSVSAYVELGA